MSNIQDDTTTNTLVCTTASTSVMDAAPLIDENKQDQVIRALQVAAISGYLEHSGSTEASCLSLCSTCRECVPIKRLTICAGMPRSLLAMICPSLKKAKTGDSSRVSPRRIVLSVHWTFDDHLTRGKRWTFEDVHSYIKSVAKGEEKKERKRSGREVISLDLRKKVSVADVNIVDINEVLWPEGTQEIALLSFNRSIDAITWPLGLERLLVGVPNVYMEGLLTTPGTFNRPLDGTRFPLRLREIILGESFNQSIEGVAWPRGLERLSLPGFDQSIRDVQWPPGLKSLEFVSPSIMSIWEDFDFDKIRDEGHGIFNQPLGTTLPSSLETLWLSHEFNQPLDGVVWPRGLVTLGFAFDFDLYRYPGSVSWPSNLRNLCTVNRPVGEFVYPPDSTVTIVTAAGRGVCDVCDIECYELGEDPNDSEEDENIVMDDEHYYRYGSDCYADDYYL